MATYYESVQKSLKEKSESGNTSYVRDKDIIRNGGNKEIWKEYNELMKEIEVSAREFVDYYYNTLGNGSADELDAKAVKRDAELKRINSKIIEKKKKLYAFVDPENKYRGTFCDGVVIGEMAHAIISEKNNVDGEKKFTSRARHTFATRAAFRHRLEADLGIWLNGCSVIDPERATYLRKEKDLLGKRNAAKRKVKSLRDDKARFKSAFAEVIDDLPEGFLAERLDNFDKQIKEAEKEADEADATFAKFRADHRDRKMTEPPIEEDMKVELVEEKKVEATEKVEDMTVEELKKVLDEAGVGYPKKPKKAELQELVVNLTVKQATEPEQSEPEQPEAETEKVAEPEQATAEVK